MYFMLCISKAEDILFERGSKTFPSYSKSIAGVYFGFRFELSAYIM